MQSTPKFYFADDAPPAAKQGEMKEAAPVDGVKPQTPVTNTGTQAQGATRQGPPQQQPPFWANPIFIMIPLMVFMLWWMNRNQKKQRDERQKLLDSVRTGDKVVTTGGIHGIVANVKDKTLLVKIADNVKIEVNRSAVENIVSRDSEEEPKEMAKK